VRVRLLLRLVLIGAGLALSLGIAPARTSSAPDRPRPAPPGKPERVYLQAFGDFPASSLTEIADLYLYIHGLPLEVLPARPLPAHTVDTARRQVISEELLDFMRRANSRIAADPRHVIIGFTTLDMYPRKLEWAYAWAWREWRVGVISTARLDPAWYGEPPDPSLLRLRLRKVVAKTVGLLYYRFPVNDNPRSALYHALSTVQDIDRVSEDF
jgi:predicted Zn-dependent protease